MNILEERMKELYEMYVGLPSNKPIVRQNTINDAFELVVLEIMYQRECGEEIKNCDIDNISRYIVAPPDGGIDIFFARQEGEDFSYDIIQVKNSVLSPREIKTCITEMKREIVDYIQTPQNVPENLRKIISGTSFYEGALDRCTYYVVHAGTEKTYMGRQDDESVLTYKDLEILKESLVNYSVPSHTFLADNSNNFMNFGEKITVEDEKGEPQKAEAFLMNLNGYDLAKLCNAYSSSRTGMNILFGQNLRDTLDTKKSKTYQKMRHTVLNEPEKFWYYNNGITIIASTCGSYDSQYVDLPDGTRTDNVTLTNFSIINGAQTTGALGKILEEAEKDSDGAEIIEKLKKVYVLTRIMQTDVEEFKKSIAINNNRQNTLSDRDLVSKNIEQRKLDERLKNGNPKIFVQIVSGSTPPKNQRFYVHRKNSTNEFLAQLAYAAFLLQPGSAKDKKTSLFKFSDDGTEVNKDYSKIFHYDVDDSKCGILLQKTNKEIDEVLFLSQLYKDAKKYIKDDLVATKAKLLKRIDSNPENPLNKTFEAQVAIITNRLDINNICMFYAIAYYYALKEINEIETNGTFDFENYYRRNSEYRTEIIKEFAAFYLEKTIEIIKELVPEGSNVNNWIRNPNNQDKFMEKVNERIILRDEQERHNKFMKKFVID